MSVSYRLPDGATMEFDQPASALEIAGRISKKLAKQALAAKADKLEVQIAHSKYKLQTKIWFTL